MIRKFWKAASWSNFSAQMPAIRPMVPSMAAPRNAKMTIHSGATNDRSANQQVMANTPKPTARPRATEASTYAEKISQCDRGVSSTNTRLPVILDWISEDEELANAFCSTLIITRPGIRKAV